MNSSTPKPGNMLTEDEYNKIAKQPMFNNIPLTAKRDRKGTRFDLICPTMLYELAEAVTEGAKRYGACNWTKGLSKSNLLNHTIEHLLNELYGDTSENHLSHAIANLMMLIHFRKDCLCHESFERDPE